jgi:hypothetical protein
MSKDPFDPSSRMANHERWRMQYRLKRYSKHLTRAELNKRIRDIFLNLLLVTEDGKVGMLPINQTGIMWMEKWTHMLEEMVIRYGPFPSGFERDVLHSEPFPNFASELATAAARRMKSLKLKPGRPQIKLGKRKYMQALYFEGKLRIQPASFFQAPNHNGAIRDDELTIGISTSLNRDQVLKIVANPQDVPSELLDQRMDLELQHRSDFWLYCVTKSVNPRLFVDFEADSCVIIRNPEEFQKRLYEAALTTMPDVEVYTGDAIYFDPLLPSKGIPFIPLTKPFGYSYQNEFRYCWQPKQPIAKLSYIDLQLGDLRDISELVEV